MSKKFLLAVAVLMVLGLAACASPAPAPAPTQPPAPPPAQPTQPPPPPAPTAVPPPTEVPIEVPNLDVFKASGHADAKAAAFNDWNDADPKEVPITCATLPHFRWLPGIDHHR